MKLVIEGWNLPGRTCGPHHGVQSAAELGETALARVGVDVILPRLSEWRLRGGRASS